MPGSTQEARGVEREGTQGGGGRAVSGADAEQSITNGRMMDSLPIRTKAGDNEEHSSGSDDRRSTLYLTL